MSAYDEITDALQAAGSTQHGRDWTCPHHKGGSERSPSLSVNEGDKGVVMICQAGCATDDVLRAIGKKKADMFDQPLEREERRIVATYDYVGEDGKLAYQVLRYEPKDFRQRKPKEGGGWEWSIKDVKRIPYHLEQLKAGVAAGQAIYVVEGEKDVEAIERAGGVATCNSGGAGKWPEEFAQYLIGAAGVTIVADNDEPGLKHARQVQESINFFAHVNNEIVFPKEGKDAADHLAHGHSLDEFVHSLVETEAEPEVETNLLRPRLIAIDDIYNIPPPQYLVQDLLVANTLAVVFGLPGHGKSFLTLDWALHMAHGVRRWMNKDVMAGPVIYLVAEGLSGYGIRMTAWRQKHPVHTAGDLHWLKDPVNLLNKQEVEWFLELCSEVQPMLVVVDTLARCMPGADENAPGPMSEAIEALDRVRRETQACVAIVHHTPKDGTTPRGHSSLLGAVQSSIKVFKNEAGIVVSTEKQKDGTPIEMRMNLVGHGPSAVLEAFEGGRMVVPQSSMTTRQILDILQVMQNHGGAKIGQLEQETGTPRTSLYRVMNALESEGKVVKLGQGWTLP